MNVTHTYALDNDTLVRVRSACDAHLKLTIEKVGDKLVKSLEVAKVRGATQNTGNVVAFEVEPEVGHEDHADFQSQSLGDNRCLP